MNSEQQMRHEIGWHKYQLRKELDAIIDKLRCELEGIKQEVLNE